MWCRRRAGPPTALVPTPMPPSVTPKPASPSRAIRPLDQWSTLTRLIESKYSSALLVDAPHRAGVRL